jgi:hypothetical protein
MLIIKILLAVWIGSILLKAIGLPFFKDIEWSNFFLVPVFYLIFHGASAVLKFIFGILFLLLLLDIAIWFIDSVVYPPGDGLVIFNFIKDLF